MRNPVLHFSTLSYESQTFYTYLFTKLFENVCNFEEFRTHLNLLCFKKNHEYIFNIFK